MPRTRQLKHDFFLNEDLAARSPMSRLLFAGLWLLADRDGRLEDRPAKIRAQLFPYEEADIEGFLLELAAGGFIYRYAIDGSCYIVIPKFKSHQHIHPDEKASTLPPPSEIPGNPRKSPEIMPSSTSPSSSPSTSFSPSPVQRPQADKPQPGRQTGGHNAPSAVDLSKKLVKDLDARMAEAALSDARLPFNFGQRPDHFHKGTKIQDLPVETCRAIIERLPRLGKGLREILEARIAQKTGDMTPAQKRAAGV